MNFYVSIFKELEGRQSPTLWRGWPRARRDCHVGELRTRKVQFHAFNGGPAFTFTPAISLFVDCQTQAEVDELWERLSAGGEKSRCGWLKDKFGLSWQIIPTALGEALNNPDPVKSKKAMEAMMQMTKIDIAALERAQA